MGGGWQSLAGAARCAAELKRFRKSIAAGQLPGVTQVRRGWAICYA